ncbi:uncharacterized protein LOC125067613 [Vanessa atalanta]|uniref:uncharacterized protein LOC125067613 n=1 Tax=Vanessa atalanta TaxID=42275 RepID=UPI001FCDEDA3|nr:uncharacterized protein LOC125067613 [Vanessa atalanta]
MWFIGILIAIFSNVLVVENRMLPIYYETEAPVTENVMTGADIHDDEGSNEKLILTTVTRRNNDDISLNINEEINEKYKKPCAIVVLSNVQNPTMQSLLRKYRYDSNGILIPDSVKYFIKLPQGLKSPSILVPLNDKAFSPLGGFVRYYKEVPPIPHTW